MRESSMSRSELIGMRRVTTNISPCPAVARLVNWPLARLRMVLVRSRSLKVSTWGRWSTPEMVSTR